MGTHTWSPVLGAGEGVEGSSRVLGTLGGDCRQEEVPGAGCKLRALSQAGGNQHAEELCLRGRWVRKGREVEAQGPLLLLLPGQDLAAPSPLTPRVSPTRQRYSTAVASVGSPRWGRRPAAAVPDPSSGSNAPRKERAPQGGTCPRSMPRIDS